MNGTCIYSGAVEKTGLVYKVFKSGRGKNTTRSAYFFFGPTQIESRAYIGSNDVEAVANAAIYASHFTKGKILWLMKDEALALDVQISEFEEKVRRLTTRKAEVDQTIGALQSDVAEEKKEGVP